MGSPGQFFILTTTCTFLPPGQFLYLVYIATFHNLTCIATFPHLAFSRSEFWRDLGIFLEFEPVLGGLSLLKAMCLFTLVCR